MRRTLALHCAQLTAKEDDNPDEERETLRLYVEHHKRDLDVAARAAGLYPKTFRYS